jgi:cytochrome P450 family 6
MGAILMISSLALIFALAAYLVKRKYSYWKDMGIPFEEPSFPYGNLAGVGKDIHLGSGLMTRIYNKFKSSSSPFAGIFFFLSPVVLVTSLDFAKTVLVKDSAYFINRGAFYNEEDGELSKVELI